MPRDAAALLADEGKTADHMPVGQAFGKEIVTQSRKGLFQLLIRQGLQLGTESLDPGHQTADLPAPPRQAPPVTKSRVNGPLQPLFNPVGLFPAAAPGWRGEKRKVAVISISTNDPIQQNGSAEGAGRT